jgi:hypothetical protein
VENLRAAPAAVELKDSTQNLIVALVRRGNDFLILKSSGAGEASRSVAGAPKNNCLIFRRGGHNLSNA